MSHISQFFEPVTTTTNNAGKSHVQSVFYNFPSSSPDYTVEALPPVPVAPGLFQIPSIVRSTVDGKVFSIHEGDVRGNMSSSSAAVTKPVSREAALLDEVLFADPILSAGDSYRSDQSISQSLFNGFDSEWHGRQESVESTVMRARNGWADPVKPPVKVSARTMTSGAEATVWEDLDFKNTPPSSRCHKKSEKSYGVLDTQVFLVRDQVPDAMPVVKEDASSGKGWRKAKNSRVHSESAFGNDMSLAPPTSFDDLFLVNSDKKRAMIDEELGRFRDQEEGSELSKRGFLTWFFVTLHIMVFFLMLGFNFMLHGSPFEFGSQLTPINYLAGPSQATWIRAGALFTPCLRVQSHEAVMFSSPWKVNGTVTLEELCGQPSVRGQGQWWRVISAMFLHAGAAHLLVTLITQVLVMIPIERRIGSLKTAAVYVVSSVTGFLLAAVLNPMERIVLGPSAGLFGLIAVWCWLSWTRAGVQGDRWSIIVCTGALCLLSIAPGIDNIANLGGFFTGLLMAVFITALDKTVTSGTSKQAVKLNRSRWLMVFCSAFALLLWIAGLIITLSLSSPDTPLCPWCQVLSCVNIDRQCSLYQPFVTIATLSS